MYLVVAVLFLFFTSGNGGHARDGGEYPLIRGYIDVFGGGQLDLKFVISKASTRRSNQLGKFAL